MEKTTPRGTGSKAIRAPRNSNTGEPVDGIAYTYLENNDVEEELGIMDKLPASIRKAIHEYPTKIDVRGVYEGWLQAGTHQVLYSIHVMQERWFEAAKQERE